MASEDVLLTHRAGERDDVLVITLNRPHVRNSVNLELARRLASTLEDLDSDDTLRVGILTGTGAAFCTGMDLKAFVVDGPPFVEGRGFAGITQRSCDKPLIAALNGSALAGGLEIALSCDILVASEGAFLGTPETSVGLFAAAGALLRLPRRVPYGIAMELALTAQPVDAARALQLGLVDRLTAPDGALDVALEIADMISKNAPLGVRASKAVLRDGLGRTEAEFWEFQDPHMPVFFSKDAMEGAAAFTERRKPVWSGT